MHFKFILLLSIIGVIFTVLQMKRIQLKRDMIVRIGILTDPNFVEKLCSERSMNLREKGRCLVKIQADLSRDIENINEYRYESNIIYQLVQYPSLSNREIVDTYLAAYRTNKTSSTSELKLLKVQT